MISERRWVLSWRATVIFVSALLLLVFAGLSARWELVEGFQTSNWIRHSNQVLDQSQAMRGDLLDAETGQRGFLLTGKTDYLEPYNKGRQAFDVDLAKLRELTATSGTQADRVEQIAKLGHAKLKELEDTIGLRKSKAPAAALAVVATDAGMQAMNDLRRVLADLDSEERRILDQRTSEQFGRRHLLRRLVGLLTVATILLLIVEAVILNRATRLRRQEEDRRRESDERLSVTLRSIGDAVIATDERGRVVFLNPVAQQLTGWSESQAHGADLQDVFRIVNEQTRQTVESPVHKVLELGTVVGLANHTVLIARDSRELPIDDSGAPMRNAQGEIVGVVLVFRDASERRLADQERERRIMAEVARAEAERFASRLAEQSQQLERALLRMRRLEESSVVGIAYADDEGIRRANPALLRGLGFAQADVEAGLLKWTTLTPPEFQARDEAAKSELFERGECAAYEKDLYRKDGTRLSVLIGAAVVTRQPLECLCVVLDLSAQKAVEEERERALDAAQGANMMKDEFLAVLSHELRSPLSAILGWASVLKRGGVPPAQFTRAVDAIERNVTLQTQLVNDLLDVSRIISGKLLLDHGAVDFAAVVQRSTENSQSFAQTKGIRLTTRFDSSPAIVIGDEKRLEQIVQNLLMNSIKFSDSGGTVFVGLSTQGERIRLEVRDSGEGIDPEFLPHLFERFRQADATRARKHGGLGLGLSIVKHLVDLHGGEVRAESEGIGRGALFEVLLPVSPNDPMPIARREPAGDDLGLSGVQILLVDDEDDTREALRLILENRGAQVQSAPSAAAGMRALTDHLPDVIVSDVAMPGEDGYSFLRHVRKRWGTSVAAVAITGFASGEDREAALKAGFNDHVAKPLDLDLLIDKIRRFARAKRDQHPT